MPFRVDPPRQSPSHDANLLRCLTCGKTTECSQTEALEYMRAGWPECCDEVMTLFIPPDEPDEVLKGNVIP